MTRYGVLLSCASEMTQPGYVVVYPTIEHAFQAARDVAHAQPGITVATCTDFGDGWMCGGSFSPSEWLAQFQ